MVRIVFLLGFIFGINFLNFAQEVQVSVPQNEVALNQNLEIVVEVRNQRLKNYSGFPEIPAFRKAGVSTRTQTQIVNGQMSVVQQVVQSYLPTKQGNFRIPSFAMTVNGTDVKFPGKRVKVGPARQRQSFDPFADFWDNMSGNPFGNQKKRSDLDFVDVKEDAFFAITADKDEAYVGEGINLTISFYVANKNQAQMEFHNLSEQLTEIIQKVKPDNAWEENFNIDEIVPESVTIQGKSYRQYKIYRGTFYPLNAGKLTIPSAGLKMVKYKLSKQRTFFGRQRQKDFKTFYSREKTLNIKPLPPHPLRDRVAVGNFKLVEEVENFRSLKSGESTKLRFRIQGEGNINSLSEPELRKTPALDFYPPNSATSINRSGTRVVGSKTFYYDIVPSEPGTFKLKDHMQWIFFNLEKDDYDTLRPDVVLSVSGESLRNAAISAKDYGAFYGQMDAASNSLSPLGGGQGMRYLASAVLIALVGGMLFFLFHKKK